MEWKWFGNAGHLIVAEWCHFHLCTQVGPYLVSTVGQYWPDADVRRIHAQHRDPKWYGANSILRGDYFDAAYRKRFGYEEVGYNRKFETMVFTAGKPCADSGCGCGMPKPEDWGELDFDGYNDAGSATRGHMAMCEKWAEQIVEVGKTAEK